jgi:2,3-dihydroxybiphenyl 1,2-dioxygenase
VSRTRAKRDRCAIAGRDKGDGIACKRTHTQRRHVNQLQLPRPRRLALTSECSLGTRERASACTRGHEPFLVWREIPRNGPTYFHGQLSRALQIARNPRCRVSRRTCWRIRGIHDCLAKQAGVRLRDGTRDEAQARSVERLVCFEDPDGNPFELFSAARCSLRPFQSTLMPRGFLTGYTGMGHVLLTVRDLDRTRAFYCDVLGFVNHGYLDWQDVGLKGLFFYCNPRHHSIAVVQTPGGKRMHHFMLETNFMEDVGYVWERALANQVPIEMSLGQHIDERTFSFYGVTPSGFLFEVGYGTRLLDVASEPFHEYKSISLWGHHRAAR